MTVESIIEMTGSLLIISAINGVIVFGITFAYLCIRDKINARKRILLRSGDIRAKTKH